ncbi:MAG: efflux RND transporter periplasmic adaptor subunit [Gammaproteobacteria bacterium]|nr:efflux RND transporter periplasmic adaptor subunit [Gammaproteobacteria bacterium]
MTKPLHAARLPTAKRNTGMLATLVAAGLLLLAGCGGKDEGKPRGAGGPPAVVTTTVLSTAPWSDSIEALGTAVARESLVITAKVSETVDQVRFESGQVVSAGQVLVTLSDRAEVAGLSEAAADYREAQALLDRQQALAKRQLIAASQLDMQRAARDAAKGRLDQLRAQVSDRVIAAPFDGVLGLRQVSPGSLVTPGTVITTLDDVSTINLDFTIPERQLSALSVGQAVVASSDAFPGEEFTGAVSSVGSRVDPATRSLAARASFDNSSGKLRAGMLLRVRLQQASRNALQVPELSLQQVGQQAFLFRVGAEDKVDQVPVRIGSRRPGWVEILDGVKAGDRIVVEGIVKLKPGARVTEAASAPAKPASPAKPGA